MKKILLIFACIILMPGCAKQNTEVSKTIYAMDTVMEIKACGENAEKAVNEAESVAKKLDGALNRGKPGSEIYKINHGDENTVSDETKRLISRALDISIMTDGAFDITVAPITDLWGFYTKEYRIPQNDEIVSALKCVGYNNVFVENENIRVRGGAQLDTGGIAKGFLSSEIYDIFKANGIESGLISLGGNIQTYGNKADGSSWKIALRHPDGEDFTGIIYANNQAVVTSGKYQRFFEKNGEKYHHIIDPATGYPSENGLESVTVVCPDAVLADGLSTALLVMGLEKSTDFWKKHNEFEAVFVTADGVYITEGLENIYESEYGFSVIKR